MHKMLVPSNGWHLEPGELWDVIFLPPSCDHVTEMKEPGLMVDSVFLLYHFSN